ncbi:hypothetical protein WL76_30895 [Burkholderia ubonensis]|uniref:hypothetical protein n=1 Tax=Burkholderia ubonensis TaxID=101571 RepID=UPI0007548C98|nr:hypothetical protein [Burkholderia ubonensis]KWE44594.1 hypothetical protein WL76_30895 [Burkholderia ubonensis]KWI27914.1 hypothetical protein WM04_22845 [Burkholderia ubonensis]OJB14027.1 hypothetical protein BGV53_23865 [Burkholderia ubonensis]
MRTIRYDILLETGLRSVAGEPLTIKNDLQMTFGVHCNVYEGFDSPKRYVVTHVESGLSVGSGSMRSTAIDDALEKIGSAQARGTLARSLEKAMSYRAKLLAQTKARSA